MHAETLNYLSLRMSNMTKSTKKAKTARIDLPGHKLLPARNYQSVVGLTDLDYQNHKLTEIAKLLWHHEDTPQEESNKRIVRALELYESLEPVDGAEGMLAMQMVGTHDAALECLRRAALPNQTFEGRDMALKHAQKLMTLYTQQLATLNKHRGKGQQKVTVEHVNVEAGGQAIVGNVDARRSDEAEQPSPKMIENNPSIPLPEVRKRKRAPKKA